METDQPAKINSAKAQLIKTHASLLSGLQQEVVEAVELSGLTVTSAAFHLNLTLLTAQREYNTGMVKLCRSLMDAAMRGGSNERKK